MSLARVVPALVLIVGIASAGAPAGPHAVATSPAIWPQAERLAAPVGANGIDAADRYKVGERIKIRCRVEGLGDSVLVARRWFGEGVSISRATSDGEFVYVWGKQAGAKRVTCVVATYDQAAPEAERLKVTKYSARFTVGDPLPPKPLPELVDAETAKSLATYCRLWCEPSVLATVSDGAAFRAAFQSQAEARRLTNNAAWPVIVDRVAVIAKDGPLEPLPLTATLQKIATELGVAPVPPTPPVPTPGKRQVVIVRESADDTPAQARIFTALRSGAEAGYLKDKGHTLLIFDDDDANSVVAKLKPLMVGPASMFVLDGQAVLAKLPLPADAPAVVAAIQANGG